MVNNLFVAISLLCSLQNDLDHKICEKRLHACVESNSYRFLDFEVDYTEEMGNKALFWCLENYREKILKEGES